MRFIFSLVNIKNLFFGKNIDDISIETPKIIKTEVRAYNTR